MPSIRRQAIEAASSYLRRHPTEVSRGLSNLLGLRIGVPLDALRVSRQVRHGPSLPAWEASTICAKKYSGRPHALFPNPLSTKRSRATDRSER